ncbi:hypothetical protein FACS1894186_5670 [Alphaproteobacteria bacterium]|nr:hypothetical protein FACS1894186_5670 [Alphaproteobacteria bacterium]
MTPLPAKTTALAEACRWLADWAGVQRRAVLLTTRGAAELGLEGARASLGNRLLEFPESPRLAASSALELAGRDWRPVLLMGQSAVFEAHAALVEAAASRLPVMACLYGAGLDPSGMSPHRGAGLAALASIPGLTVGLPSDPEDLTAMLARLAGGDEPAALRFSSVSEGLSRTGRALDMALGKGRVVRRGWRVAFLNFGALLPECLEAASRLAGRGIVPTVADMRFIRPLDTGLAVEMAMTHDLLMVVEDSMGAAFGLLARTLAADGFLDRGPKIRSCCMPDAYFSAQGAAALRTEARLTPEHLISAVLDALDEVEGKVAS